MSELNNVLQSAQAHYQAGNLAEAEVLYRQVVERQPQDIPALSWLAAIAERTGRPDVGIAYYEQILLLNPALSETHSNLGSLLCQQGQIVKAIVHHRQALRLAPYDPDTHYNLGVVFYQDRQWESAIDHYQQAIRLQPNYANAYNNLGVTLSQLKRQEEAIAAYQQAVLHNPNHANAHNNLGVALAQEGKTEAAIVHYQKALALDPNVPNAHDNLGMALKQLNRLEEAIAHYQQAITLKPNEAASYDNLGTALQAQGNLEAAIDSYQQAIVRDPDYANVYGNLASALKEQGNLERAIEICEQGLKLQHQNTHIHNVYGGILADQGEITGAITHFEQALRNEPDHADTHLNLGMMLLAVGDFARGFGEYHWRWQTNQCPNLRYREALWNGLDLGGKTILLTAEQGFGDTIQFVRYAALVAQKGGQVVIACQKPLLRLLETVPGVTQCVDRDRVDVDTHVHAPLLDLPLLLGTRLETIPASIPYLRPPQDSPVRLQQFPGAAFKIGFVWATNPSNSTSAQRSCKLSHFLDLLEIPGVALYSLQKDRSAADQDLLKTCDRLQDLHSQIHDFADTATAIKQLNLVISVDTAVAHLAGALGKPTWTLLPFSSDWRWMRDRADTPWYPTMRLFRQDRTARWAMVFDQVRSALVQEVSGSSSFPLSVVCPSIMKTATEAATELHDQGTQLMRQGDLEAAVLIYRQAIELRSDDAAAYSNLGLAFKDLNQPDIALPYIQQALHLQPDRADFYNSYGCTLIDLGKAEQAIEQFRRSLKLNSSYADAHLNLGMALLMVGQFQSGFAEYRWRWRNKLDFSLPYPEALWDGSDLNGKTILLTAEQGFGDTIQFVRYAALVAQKGGQVVIACPKALVRLLQTVAGVSHCIDRDTEAAQTHFHAPLLELPRIFATTPTTIPAQVPYLAARQFQFSIPLSPDFKVGIAWLTSSTSSTAGRRSCLLSQFLESLELPGVALYSLQKNPSIADRALLQSHAIFDLDPQIHDFADTAAAIEQLDLVISVDTAVAHLTGALGKPVWTLLPFAPDWRWMRGRADTPWYPTMRLLRQSKPGEWAEVFAQIFAQLQDLVAERQRGEGAEEQGGKPVLPCLRDGSRKLKQTRHGVLLYGGGEVGRSLDLYGEWREGVLNLLQHFVRPGDTIVEVGANVGVHTLFFAQAVGATGTVVAIEAERLTFQTLCANLVLNGLTQVHAHQSEPALQTGECRLMVLHGGTALPLLKAASQRILTSPSIVYLEPSPQESTAIVQLLKLLNYDLYWHPVPWFSPNNYDRNLNNELGSLTTTYLFGLPRSFGITVNGLQPVASPDFQ